MPQDTELFGKNGSAESTVSVLLMTIFPDAESEGAAMSSLAELRQLCETALEGDCEKADFFLLTQMRPHPEAATYLGKGKLEEAAGLCRDHDIRLAVMDDELSPSQIRNMENILSQGGNDVRVIDRTMLILDIFARHAVTGEGKLQVEIAQLRYTAPRLTGRGTELSRQGGTSGAIGARGPGETKLETDRRHIHRRIEALEERIREMDATRSTKRKSRSGSGICSVAIAGYTNAGKSTLLNYLTGAGILAENKLFATLDPTTRKLTLPSGREVLLTDTVGFIDRLPHKLVEAFKSTLDEVKYADIILLVADASDPECEKKTVVTEELINDLGAGGTPRILCFNKCDGMDILPLGGDAERLAERNAVCISAATGKGVDGLLGLLEKTVNSLKKEVTFLFPFSEQAAVNVLFRKATVLSTDYTDDGTLVTALCDEELCGKYKDYIQ